jgi:hypothetical protein
MAEPDTSPFRIPSGKGWLVANCLGAAAFLYLLHQLWLIQAEQGYTFADGFELLVLTVIFALGNILSLLSGLVLAARYRSWVPMKAPLIGVLIWGAVLFYFHVQR